MFSKLSMKTKWNTHHPTKRRMFVRPSRRHFGEQPSLEAPLSPLGISRPERPSLPQTILEALEIEEAERKASQGWPSQLELLKPIASSILEMSPDNLATETAENIRNKLGMLLIKRKWLANEWIANNQPDKAAKIQEENIQLEEVHQQFKRRCGQDLFYYDYLNIGYYDVFIGDIAESALFYGGIPYTFGVPYLSRATEPPVWPVNGIMAGKHKRIFVNLTVKRYLTESLAEMRARKGGTVTIEDMLQRRKDPPKDTPSLIIFFLVDNTAPATYLSAVAMEELQGNQENFLRREIRAHVHGKLMSLFLSPPGSHIAGLNVLGSDFLRDCQLWTDYSRSECTLSNNPRLPPSTYTNPST